MTTLDSTKERLPRAATQDQTLGALLCRLGTRCVHADELDGLLDLLLATCDVVAALHCEGELHGALEPDNVMLGDRGDISLQNGGHGSRIGAPSFMATEQAWSRRKDFNERTDVYGMGAILYCILTQLPPHQGSDARDDLELAKRGTVRTPQNVHPLVSLPSELCRIAMRALAANPADRHPSIVLLKQDIQRFMCRPV